MEQQKILIITFHSTHSYILGGLENYSKNLILLDKSQFEELCVNPFIYDWFKSVNLPKNHTKKYCKTHFLWNKTPRILRFLSKIPIFGAITYRFFIRFRLSKWLKQSNYKKIIIMTCGIIDLWTVKKKILSKSIFIQHLSIHTILHKQKPTFIHKLLKICIFSRLKFVSKIVVYTNQDKNILLNEKNLNINHNHVEVRLYPINFFKQYFQSKQTLKSQKIVKKNNQIVFFSRWDFNQKDLSFFFKLVRKFSNYNFILSGTATKNVFTKAKLITNNISNVKLIHEFNKTKLLPLLQESSWYICCSKFEGYPLAIVEMLTYGLPIIGIWSEMTYCYSHIIGKNERGILIKKTNNLDRLYDNFCKLQANFNYQEFLKSTEVFLKTYLGDKNIKEWKLFLNISN